MAEIPTVPAKLLDRYRNAPSGLVTDALGRLGLAGWMDDVLPLNPSWRLGGRVRTVKFAPRNGIKRTAQSMYSIVREFDEGDVLVIDTGGTRSWVMGENIAHMAMYQGLLGIVTDGRVRDANELRELPLPVFSRGVSARPPHTEIELVAWDVPVECGGAQVRPGDVLVGDCDGIVIVPNEAADAMLVELDDLAALEVEQERVIGDRAPVAAIQEIIRRKKQRKGPPLVVDGRI